MFLIFPLVSGRAPSKLTLNLLKNQGFTDSAPPPAKSAHNVTVPGAAAAWVDTVEMFGSNKVHALHYNSTYAYDICNICITIIISSLRKLAGQLLSRCSTVVSGCTVGIKMRLVGRLTDCCELSG